MEIVAKCQNQIVQSQICNLEFSIKKSFFSALYCTVEEIFIVLIPDDTTIDNSFGFMDVICGDSHLDTNSTDTTGIGFGDFTGRITSL